MKLEDTIGLMCSDDYKDRLKAEYLQLVLRLRSINRYWESMGDNAASAEGSHVLEQMIAMKTYKAALYKRLNDNGLFPETLDAIVGEE